MHYLDCPNSDLTQIYKHSHLGIEKLRVCIYIHIASRKTFKVLLLKNAFWRKWLLLCNISRWYLDLHVIVIAHQHLLKPHAKVRSRSCCSKTEKFWWLPHLTWNVMIFPDMWYLLQVPPTFMEVCWDWRRSGRCQKWWWQAWIGQSKGNDRNYLWNCHRIMCDTWSLAYDRRSGLW